MLVGNLRLGQSFGEKSNGILSRTVDQIRATGWYTSFKPFMVVQDTFWYLVIPFWQDTTHFGMPGWRIVGHINGSEIYFVTNSSTTFPKCPVGLTNASTTSYDGYEVQLVHDPTFSIQCHSEEVKDQCQNCQTMEVQAQNEVFDHHLQRLGNYTRVGDFNGYPYYQLEQYNVTNYLYYRKDGKWKTHRIKYLKI